MAFCICIKQLELDLAEDQLHEVIQAVSPMRWIVAVAIHMPDVRHAMLLQVGVNALIDAEQSILAATGKHQEFQLALYGLRVRHKFRCWFGVWGR